jgi:hypothetical protein
MTRGTRLLPLALAGCGLLVAAGSSLAAPPSDTAFRIQVTGRGGAADGACFLLHEERWEGEFVEYFVTSARLFDPATVGKAPLALTSVRILVGEDRALETNGTNVAVSEATEGGYDLAIVRIFSPDRMTPAATTFDAIEAGRVFVVESGSGAPAMFGRIKAQSTTLAVAEPVSGDVRALIGAPATIGGRVFGVLTDYDAHNTPIIALLAGARDFLSDYATGWTVSAATPFTGEAALPGDIPRSFRLGDVTVLVLHDEVVKLRFSMIGNGPMSTVPPITWTPPLVAVGVDVVKSPRP